MVEESKKEIIRNEIPEIYTQKCVPKYSRNILRIEHIIKNAEKFIETEGTIAGWSRTCRLQANNTLVFIELSDGSCFSNLQIVVDKGYPNFEEVSKCGVACSFKITGKFVKSPGKNQVIEMQVGDQPNHSIKVFGTCDNGEYPLAKKKHKVETLRDILHLRPRTNIIGAATRVRNSLSYATHLFYQNLGFMYIHTPIISCSDCEGAGERFQVTTILPDKSVKMDKFPINKEANTVNYSKDFFKSPAYLTVSGQLNVEPFACAMTNVYTFGPTFRAEKSHTSKHLAEFWMIEPEIAFADVNDCMDLAEDYVKFCLRYVVNNHLDDLEFFDLRVKKGIVSYLKGLLSSTFLRKSYEECIDELKKIVKEGKKKFEFPVDYGLDLATEHERCLVEEIYKSPIFLYNFPKSFKPFYMKVNSDNKTVAAFDMLVPQIGELIGGSQREDNLSVLEDRIKECNLNSADYWWYKELRKYGTVPHSGFGLGFERLVMLVTGIENIRETIPYPRFEGNAEF